MSASIVASRTFVIFGAKKGTVGCGLVSSLSALHVKFLHGHKDPERFKLACIEEVNRWRQRIPDWNFDLTTVPERTDGYRGPDYGGIEALYDRDLNA